MQFKPFEDSVREMVKGFSPAYFAMVMATGIISIAAHLLGISVIAVSLFWLNIFVYPVLWFLSILRAIWFTNHFFGDMVDHKRGPGFFTSIAGSCVLGSQFVLIPGNYWIAISLWVIGIILWICLTYTIFTAFIIKENKPSLSEGITGGWLLAVVATQSIAVLSALIALHWEQPYKLEVNFFALSMWLWGGMLYIWMISLIFYRYTFFKFSPGDLTPPYWINMGAMAISTLAGSLLIANSHDAPFLQSLLPFLKGFTVFYWATGTWWIPMLIILGMWRYVYKRFPLEYDPLYWGAIFPLGMYTACTFQMAKAMDLEFLYVIPRFFIYIALSAWMAAFAGLVYLLTSWLKTFISAE
ncbi:MAG: tellurite resistance/C4-dicarboxylate transporter family protein [Candidatus Loosdrechtia sp.]|uniref:tellurite resistance/C4-dicarboxylate transporter family protein n=1 Tax=Candidatus Loosdrechtia sp. TaxID=3101272 RepID=UPI003A6732CD|nr:MAG: tellurite resistance/C4-dicarboxylate transporter family protein [Candidatus Jettenia sp. AMX2]